MPFLSCDYLKEKPHFKHYCTSAREIGGLYAAVLNKRDSTTLTIERVRNHGFVLSNNTELVGSTIVFPHCIISWHVNKASEISEESLTLFKILDPKVDILIFGFGNSKDFTKEVQMKFIQFCKKYKIRFEALPTHQAVGLFNFLSLEMRYVAAALIPPNAIDKLPIDKSREWELEDYDEDFEENVKKEKYIEGGNKNLKLLSDPVDK